MTYLHMPSVSMRLSRWQRPVWRSTARVKVICAGRGAGKDIICIRCGLRDAFIILEEKLATERRLREARRAKPSRAKRRALKRLGDGQDGREGGGPPSAGAADGKLSDEAISNPYVKIWLIAEMQANLDQLRDDFEGELVRLARDNGIPSEALFRWKARESTFEILGERMIQAELKICSTKDALRGPGVDVAIWTEFAVAREEAWKVEFQGTITRAGRRGRVYLNSTPKGRWRGPEKTSLWWDLCERAKSRKNWAYFDATAYDNDFLEGWQIEEIDEEWETAKANGEEWIFEQERLARFVTPLPGGSRVFGKVKLALAGAGSSRPAEGGMRSLGLDCSRDGDDFTGFVEIDEESGVVVDVELIQKTSGPQIVEGVKLRHEKANGRLQTTMDGTQHQAYLKDWMPPWCRVRLLKIYETEKERQVLNLLNLLELGRIVIPDPETCPWLTERQRPQFAELIRQIRSYVKTTSQPTMKRSYSAPTGDHDDAVTALMLAVDPIASRMGRDPGSGDRAIDKARGVLW